MKFSVLPGLFLNWRQLLPAILVVVPSGMAVAAPLAPVPDFFQYDYGALLPLVSGAATGAYTTVEVRAAAAGGGGWLTAWTELRWGRESQEAKVRLRARMLPTEGNTGMQEVTLDMVTSKPYTSPPHLDFRVERGDGGGWIAWADVQHAISPQAVWVDQVSGKPVGQPMKVSPPGYFVLSGSAGDGTTAWVFSRDFTSYLPGPLYGSVLRKSDAGPLPPLAFVIENQGFRGPLVCSGHGKCLLSEVVDTVDGQRVRTMAVDARGLASPAHDLLSDGNWLGAVSYQDGFYGVWITYFPSPLGALVFGRELTMEGEWKPGTVPQLIAPVGTLLTAPRLTPGQDGAVLSLGGNGNFRLRPGLPLAALPGVAPDIFNQYYALDRTAVLETGTDRDRRPIAKRFASGTTVPEVLMLASGAGRQQAPSLAWTDRGPQVVFQVDGYGKDAASQTITGFNQAVGGKGGWPITAPAFSTAAQAWQGNHLQLVTYRQEHQGTLGLGDDLDPDDVMGQLFTADQGGVLTRTGPAFPLASGPGSQRGVAVAPFGTGFLAAWREETTQPFPASYTSSIRAAFVTPEGTVKPPGGKLLDISVEELSAVSVAGDGLVAWKYPQLGEGRTGIRTAQIYNQFPDQVLTVRQYRNPSPPGHDAVSPQVVANAGAFVVAWRDKITHRIFVSQLTHVLKGATPVSPAGRYAREPALANLTPGVSAVFWLEDMISWVEIWMVTLSDGGVSEPSMVTKGDFDRDTLVACGDGQGRVVLGMLDISLETPGLKLLLVAPQIQQNGGLAISAVGGGLELSWDTSVLFPNDASLVESSMDLSRWDSPGTGSTPTQISGRTQLQIPLPASTLRQFFRLEAKLTQGQ